MPTPAPHFILSFRTRRACDGQPRRTEVFATIGYEGWDHPQSLDAAEPQSLGQFTRPEYARVFGWQRLLEVMKADGFNPAEANFAEIPSDNHGDLRSLDLKEVLQCARKAARTTVRVKPAAEPAYA